MNPYLGSEIPEYQALGLQADKLYRLYRDAAALKAAVPNFDGIPLLIDHVVVSAADPKEQMIAGTVGDRRWDNGKVIGTVSVWDASAIQGIETSARRDLSAGYRYRCVVQPGTTPDGDEFDARMLDIIPNHVALAVDGRVSGAMVGDSARTVRRVRRASVLTVNAALRPAAQQRAARDDSAFAHDVPGYYRLP